MCGKVQFDRTTDWHEFRGGAVPIRTTISGTKFEEFCTTECWYKNRGTTGRDKFGNFSAVICNLVLLRKINKRALFTRFSLRGFFLGSLTKFLWCGICKFNFQLVVKTQNLCFSQIIFPVHFIHCCNLFTVGIGH
jgi:hypothetical protein